MDEGGERQQAVSQGASQPAAAMDLEARLAKAEADAAGYLDQLKRTMADFDNYRKRILKEREELSKAAAERIIVEIIEPVENLDRALEAAKAAKNLKKLRDGVAMTRDQIWSVLERNGLKRVETAGCAFDPRWHEAVEQVSDDEADDGTVKGEIRSGYVLNGKVLRCAKVKVSKKSTVEIRE